MDALAAGKPVVIDLVYADAAHPENIFGAAIYRRGAPMILHKDLAEIVMAAAHILHQRHGWTLVLKDGLRPVEAQEALAATDIVKSHPEWLAEPGRLLSPPGAGAHPRGMAIDVAAQRPDGQDIDMGTRFDTMTAQSARGYMDFAPHILQNRHNLEMAFVDAARACALPLLPLPSEWWDFRLPKSYYGRFDPLRDANLPAHLRMTGAHART